MWPPGVPSPLRRPPPTASAQGSKNANVPKSPRARVLGHSSLRAGPALCVHSLVGGVSQGKLWAGLWSRLKSTHTPSLLTGNRTPQHYGSLALSGWELRGEAFPGDLESSARVGLRPQTQSNETTLPRAREGLSIPTSDPAWGGPLQVGSLALRPQQRRMGRMGAPQREEKLGT